MPSIKLTYFNGRGRAETIRLLLAVAGVKYEDYRMKPEEWPEIKPKTPYGQVPMLEVDGRKFAQSMAICRSLAEKYDLYGRNSTEKAAIDGCCEVITEIREKLFTINTSKEPEKDKKKKLDGFKEVELPELLTKLDTCLKKNKGGKEYFYGDKISMADVHFFAVMEHVLTLDPNALKEFEKLSELLERVKNVRKINEYLETRPDTEF